MGQLNLSIASRRDDATLKAMFETPGSIASKSIANKIVNFITGVATGTELGPTGSAPSVAISIEGQATAASGTFTVSSTGSANNETCVVAGVTFTAKTTGATGNQFNISATPATQAANMVTAFNASTSLAGIVTATSALGVVTVTAAAKGKMGNGLGISSGLTNCVASAALLSGGAVDPTATTLSF